MEKWINMINLDDTQEIKKTDKSGVLSSIELFPEQCFQAIEETEKLELPYLEGKIDDIVIPGMGGSAFAPEIVKTLFSKEIKVPYEIIRDYHLPGYVNKRTLVIISSYSATTKEAISAGKEALEIGCPVFVICSHREKNELFILAKEKNLPGYIFKETYNPSLQPRLGGGYMVCGHTGLLIKTGLIDSTFERLKEAILAAKNIVKKDEAKQLAKNIYGYFPILVASEFLEGAIHGFANQLNENAKTNSTYHFIPELNHHRMEGLEFPQEFKKIGIFIFYPSQFYEERVQIRYQLTKEIVEKNGFKTLEFKPQGQDKIVQAFETMIFNSYLSFYLAILYGKDPGEIPWVDYFKEKLAAHEK